MASDAPDAQSFRPSEISSWARMEQRLLAMERETTALGSNGRDALHAYGRKALDDKERALFGTQPLKEPLMVSVCKQCMRPVISSVSAGGVHHLAWGARSAPRRSVPTRRGQGRWCVDLTGGARGAAQHFDLHREFCTAPSPASQPVEMSDGVRDRVHPLEDDTDSGQSPSKRQAIAPRRALRFVQTRDITPINAIGAAPVEGLVVPHLLHRSFTFQLGDRFVRGHDRMWSHIHQASQVPLPDGVRPESAGDLQLAGLLAGVGGHTLGRCFNLWMAPPAPVVSERFPSFTPTPPPPPPPSSLHV